MEDFIIEEVEVVIEIFLEDSEFNYDDVDGLDRAKLLLLELLLLFVDDEVEFEAEEL